MIELLKCLLPLLAIFSPAGSDVPAADNFLENPGFEEAVGDEPIAWQRIVDPDTRSCEIGVTRDGAKSGKQAVRIARVWGKNRSGAGIRTSRQIPLDPRATYLLSFWYRTSGTEYSLPFMADFRVQRKDHDPLLFKRLKISSSPGWRQVFILIDGLPADAVSADLGFTVYMRTRGELLLDDVLLKKADKKDVQLVERWRKQQLPTVTRDAATVAMARSANFRLAEVNGIWWLVQPNGKPTWSIGTMGRYPSEERGSPSMRKWARQRYSSEADYRKGLYGLVAGWGFNSFEGWTDDEFGPIIEEHYLKGEAYLPMFKVLSLSRDIDPSLCARDRDGHVKDGSHAFPDPFNPAWRQHAAQKAASSIEMFRNKPWLVGWFVDNEIDFLDLFRFVWADYSAKEFVSDLETKYKRIEELNRAWTSKYGTYRFESFAEILSKKPEPADWEDPLFADFTAFERRMVREYVDFTYQLVKKADPSRLVISNRINLGPMQDIHRTIDLWARFDLIAMNIYPQNIQHGLSQGELEVIETLHKSTGKPLIISEWGVSAIDSGLYDLNGDPQGRPLDWSWQQIVRTQRERRDIYEACITQFASLGYVVGSHWFTTLDVDTKIRRANRGILDTNHEPYAELVSGMKEVHARLTKRMHLPPVQR
jgi:hypothetical protein